MRLRSRYGLGLVPSVEGSSELIDFGRVGLVLEVCGEQAGVLVAFPGGWGLVDSSHGFFSVPCVAYLPRGDLLLGKGRLVFVRCWGRVVRGRE